MEHVDLLLLFKNLKYFSKKYQEENKNKNKKGHSFGLGAFF